MKLSKKLENLYDSIQLFERYNKLSEEYRHSDELLEKTDKKKVIQIFENFGYKAKYRSGEKFYQITEEICNYQFYFHVSLRYGKVELIFGLKKEINGEHYGGSITSVCKRIEITKEDVSEGYIKKPSFKSYQQLENILQESLLIYEDFKKEFVKEYSN